MDVQEVVGDILEVVHRLYAFVQGLIDVIVQGQGILQLQVVEGRPAQVGVYHLQLFLF